MSSHYLRYGFDLERREIIRRALEETTEATDICYGKPRAGKSLLLQSLSIQLVSTPTNIVCLDAGGNPSWYHRLVEAGKQQIPPREVVLVTPERNFETAVFDPLQSNETDYQFDPPKIASIYTSGVGIAMQHGVYGKDYFAGRYHNGVLDVAERNFRVGTLTTPDAILAALKRMKNSRDLEQLADKMRILKSLTHVMRPPLPGERAVRWGEMDTNGTIYYFAATAMDALANPYLLTHAEQSLLTDRMTRQKLGIPTRPTTCFWDEVDASGASQVLAQHMAGGMKYLRYVASLTTARSLEAIDKNVAAVIDEDAVRKFYFSPVPDAETILRYSKEHLDMIPGQAPTGLTGRGDYRTRLSINTILEVSQRRHTSIMIEDRKRDGHHEPFIVYHEPELSLECYKALQQRSYPKLSSNGTVPTPRLATAKRNQPIARDAVWDKWQAVFSTMYDKLALEQAAEPA